tara:strand:- start:3870 stop:6956 length:3087 start_codon:yes stop_codon:yes gene_type:complete
MIKYSELHCVSNFTFLKGASYPEELVKQAESLGYSAIALTDECSIAGVVKAHIAAKKCSLSLIIGSMFSITDGPSIVLLATNREGYGNLVRLITRARLAAKKGDYHLVRSEIHTIDISECLGILISNPSPDIKKNIKARYKQLKSDAVWLKKLLPNRIWISVEQPSNSFDYQHLLYLQDISMQTDIPLVATGNVHMHIRSRQKIRDTLTAIRLGKTINKIKNKLNRNAEQHLRTLELLGRTYPSHLLYESVNISNRCKFSLDEIYYSYPNEFIPKSYTKTSYLKKITYCGIKKRWPHGPPNKIYQQIKHELNLIKELSYESYFLSVYDIVNFARENNILCQGRGSAANSAVCYCLGITEVDPTRINLLFERFISKERNEPPDIDVDFEHEKREKVIQYIYQKYGRDRAALTASVVTYRSRSAIRDVAKALDFNLNQISQIEKYMGSSDITQINSKIIEPLVYQGIQLINELIGFPRHFSQHPGGFLLSHEPLCNIVPTENASMTERTIIQWDKNDIDALGLLKIDCLALGMLSVIEKSLNLINIHRGQDLSIAKIPSEDPNVYKMISKADTIGVFQIESRAQMAMLPRFRPNCFYDLVIEIAIVRPGPIQGDMVHPYLKRRQGKETVTYPSKDVRHVLERTLGIPIFQEQVMQLAIIAAGFSPGQADELRRSISSWRDHGDLESYKEILFNGMKKRGYSNTFARQIYRQILGFAKYGFPESHAASFALLVYVSAWLKYHEPAIFTCSLLNSQPMGFYNPSQLIQDANRHNVKVNPIDISISNWNCTIENTNNKLSIRLGLRLIKGLSQISCNNLIKQRIYKPFYDLNDLAQRTRLSQKELQALTQSGALKTLVRCNRHQAAWYVSGILNGTSIFKSAQLPEGIPMIRSPNKIQDIYADYASTGLTLNAHPISLVRPRLDQFNAVNSDGIRKCNSGQIAYVAGLVIARQKPSTAKNTTFVTLEDEAGSINLIVWETVAKKYNKILNKSKLLGALGAIETADSVVHIIAHRLFDHTNMLRDLITQPRNYK